MSATVQQDLNAINVEGVDESYLETLKERMILSVPETAKLFEPRYVKDFDWEKARPHPDDIEAMAEMEHNKKVRDEKASKSEIQSLLVAELITALMKNTGPQFKTTKLKSNYDQEQALLDMAHRAKQLEAMNTFAKGNINTFLSENGIDTESALNEAMKERGPGSLHELTKQFELSSTSLMDLMQDSSKICASNPSVPNQSLDSIGGTIDSMKENMREMQDKVVKNVMELVDSIISQFTK